MLGLARPLEGFASKWDPQGGRATTEVTLGWWSWALPRDLGWHSLWPGVLALRSRLSGLQIAWPTARGLWRWGGAGRRAPAGHAPAPAVPDVLLLVGAPLPSQPSHTWPLASRLTPAGLAECCPHLSHSPGPQGGARHGDDLVVASPLRRPGSRGRGGAGTGWHEPARWSPESPFLRHLPSWGSLFWPLGTEGLGCLLGLQESWAGGGRWASSKGRLARQVTRECTEATARPCPRSPGIHVPWPGARRVRRLRARGVWALGCPWLGSNCVFSLCSCCSKAVFSKSLDIAEAHPQFSKEDRYTPCPPAPAPQPPSDVGLVAGLGRRCIQHAPLWPGNLPASQGTAGSGQAEPRRSGAAGEADGQPRRAGRPTVLSLPWGPKWLQV